MASTFCHPELRGSLFGRSLSGKHCEIFFEDCQENQCESSDGLCYDAFGQVPCSASATTSPCAENITLTSKGYFKWPVTEVNSVATLDCFRLPGHVATRRCSYFNLTTALWMEANVDNCTTCCRYSLIIELTIKRRCSSDEVGHFSNTVGEGVFSDILSASPLDQLHSISSCRRCRCVVWFDIDIQQSIKQLIS
ncbi:hypothetical protein HELRODRAFT_167768 [Helobdella robusta]|uniref:G-protein coupled receptors family 2 profile 1 domain-containing protein n=1 Tax=Helobdella robusta TaxID=6412 RepID=T1EZS4_HELRO|nr:hypothetical protein HELRODRAFT_167768 [Helobdella robusta]ESO09941.1 hypothetical protein HELRODRAFT_167768 [Helobdella robusta]